MLDVVLQVRPVEAEAEARRNVWRVLQELPEENFTPASEAHEEGGLRYEIFSAAPGQSLREWLGAHRPTAAMIEAVVQQLAQNIETLHQAGLVHLNLRPETVYVGEDDHHLKIVIGGLYKAQVTDRAGLVAIEANPYYAPPEAGGLFQHQAGESLRAWDWWALGRIVQEMVLGCHVYGLVMERDVRANPPELRARAEALLLERDPTALRSGAVELLPEDTGSRLRLILRGLLASVREGRWRWPQVEAWLRGDQPVDRYDLPRNTRLIRRGEQALTLVEIADLYAQPAYFAEGVAQLFPEDDTVESIWGILQEAPQFRAEFEKVQVLREMVGMPPWQGQPPALRRAAVAGLVWLTLVPATQRRPLCFGEYGLNVPGLRRMFRESEGAEAALAVLTAKPYLQRVAALDPAAAKALELLAKAGREAVGLARGWSVALRPAGVAALLGWVLASESELAAKCDALRARYMVCREASLDAWLRGAIPTRVGLALLAAAGEDAEAQGFVTREEWTRRRHAELLARSALLAETLFWRRLERLVAATPAFLGFWPVSLMIWILPLTLTLLAQEWVLAGLTTFVAVAGRWAGTQAVRGAVARYAPGRNPWKWNDRAIRGRREAHAVLPAERERAATELEQELAGLEGEFRRLALPVGAAAPAAAPHLRAMWCSSVLAMAAPLVLLAGVVAPRYSLSQSGRSASVAAVAAPAGEKSPALIRQTGADGQVQLYELVQDGFGGHRRGPLKPWNLPKPVAPSVLKVVGEAPASGNQRAYAIVSAELLLAPYPRQERNELLAVPVYQPREARPWIVLYDTATHRLADGQTYGIGSELVPSTWYSLTGREVIYLGESEAITVDDLIPLP
jgi:hypothetical protein